LSHSKVAENGWKNQLYYQTKWYIMRLKCGALKLFVFSRRISLKGLMKFGTNFGHFA